MAKILEGLWDCPYCKTKGIGGLTKSCPCCGHPQDNDTKFYMGTQKKYLDEDLAKQYGQGADWVCPYCGSLNRYRFKFCQNCGAPKEESQKDYFTARKTAEETKVPVQHKVVQKQQPKKKSFLPIILLLVIAAALFAFWPRSMSGEVTAKAWQRTIDVESYRTVQESDWSVPDGGRVYDQKQEIHHYDSVLDHYETRSRQVSEQVYDGEDVHTSYSDNGDGTFTENTYSTPRYRTEYHTETYQEPIYRQVPKYQTKYYYEIERWLYDRTEQSSGEADEPYWPPVTLTEMEREAGKAEHYSLTVDNGKGKRCTFEVAQDRWEKYNLKDKAKLTIVMEMVTKLDGESID